MFTASKKKKLYSIKKCRHILQNAYTWYKQNWKKLSKPELERLEANLEILDNAVIEKDRDVASDKAHQVDDFVRARRSKNWGWFGIELVLAILFALAVATVVRQTWFELYEIPTGSMRPTYKEKDNLLVTKTAFGINVPMMTRHFHFDPSLVKRGDIVIWSGDNIDLPDTDTTYFGILPYKKRYVKRLIGKPGDTLYFYGGKIYGIDNSGNAITDLLDAPWLNKLEYLPFSSFEGRIIPSSNYIRGGIDRLTFRQMNLPIGRTLVSSQGLQGKIKPYGHWVQDNPKSLLHSHDRIESYSDFWGIGNFAMARLLTKRQAESLHFPLSDNSEATLLYLELKHTPYLNPLPKNKFPEDATVRSLLPKTLTTVIPLQKKHLQAIMDTLYTARFIVRQGVAKRYSAEGGHFSSDSPIFSTVPDGTYEFYYGKAYRIGWGAVAKELSNEHPLYNLSPENVQKLFNLGIEFSNQFSPQNGTASPFPSRFAYFRDGCLYLMGGKVLASKDPVLQSYVKKELARKQGEEFYVPFVDKGPPLQNEKLKTDFIKAFGLVIPEKHYLVLGDNHAMSADSRFFGFVPEENLQGSPSLLFWPPGHRAGPPPQPIRSWATSSNATIWGIAAVVFLAWIAYHQYKKRLPIFKKLSK